MGLFSKKSKDVEIFAPIDGEIVNLSEVPDEVFAEKMMGDGFGFKPNASADGEFIAPMDGELVTVFPTGHAYGIKNKSGVEMLLHIGLDTVNLNGEGFDVKVKQGDKVEHGTPLVIVDLKEVSKKVPSTISPMVFTGDSLNGKSFEMIKTGKVKKGDLIAVVK